jgi:hypothetical protein
VRVHVYVFFFFFVVLLLSVTYQRTNQSTGPENTRTRRYHDNDVEDVHAPTLARRLNFGHVVIDILDQ